MNIVYSSTPNWDYFTPLAVAASVFFLIEAEHVVGSTHVLKGVARFAKLIDTWIVLVRFATVVLFVWLINTTLVVPYQFDMAAYGEALHSAFAADPLPIIAALVFACYGRAQLFLRLANETGLPNMACYTVAEYMFVTHGVLTVCLFYLFLGLPLITLGYVLVLGNALGLMTLDFTLRAAAGTREN